jgi:predicted amidophosphoribosyltransferase
VLRALRRFMPPPAAVVDTKACPQCAMTIPIIAKRCPHCTSQIA